MAHYELEYFRNTICLKMKNSQISNYSINFMGIAGVIIFLMPILTIAFLSIDISFGSIMVCILAWLIAGYFIKIYLWNKFGMEVFIIKDNNLEIYNDYKYFKENFRNYQFENIDISFFIDEKDFEAKDIEKSSTTLDIDQLSKIGFYVNNELILSHIEIPISDIIDIAKSVKKSSLRIDKLENH
ncbi:MAG: hypothetical protein E6767_20810 [Dysgonomonas sp.]|nr:hypothetical protein [Dysgonomonas sp.]